MFINPLNLVTYLAKTGGSAAFTKLREHFHLTNKDLKEHATAKNICPLLACVYIQGQANLEQGTVLQIYTGF